MSSSILPATVFEVNTEVEFPHVCRDCGQILDSITQIMFRGEPLELITCKASTCTLYGVTLSVEQYARLSECEIQAYRVMVANRKFMAVGE